MILEGTPPDQLKQSLSAPGSITGQAISRLEERGLLELVDSELTGAISRAKNRK
jgi:pyrroline-5-carboxylate reductase